MAYASFARMIEVFWLEPRARDLAIDAEGVRHPRTRVRVSWPAVTALQRGWLGFVLVFAGGARIRVPHSLFIEGVRAEAHLARLVGKPPRAPYRS